ncbi:hypothetical protein DPMN_169910 [Dreissena polymorpha]|uniref:Uncharacterized protein n=1 Tax=Dreissena polymorpha TaxID=45954 RepID=A0A9D4DW39_DREPO|nr:hypothetical protein DPMN_169910 [Dreissena polymorpha]
MPHPLVAMFFNTPEPFSTRSRYHWDKSSDETKFHEDQTIHLAFRPYKKNAPPNSGHVLQPPVTILEFIQDMRRKNLLTKSHEDQTINVISRVLTMKNAPPSCGHVFQPTGTIFKLGRIFSPMLTRKKPRPMAAMFFNQLESFSNLSKNLLTKFHDNQTINVASRVKNAPPTGGHVFQATVTIFTLVQDIIETNILTKFCEDQTTNVASRVLTRQMLTP